MKLTEGNLRKIIRNIIEEQFDQSRGGACDIAGAIGQKAYKDVLPSIRGIKSIISQYQDRLDRNPELKMVAQNVSTLNKALIDLIASCNKICGSSGSEIFKA